MRTLLKSSRLLVLAVVCGLMFAAPLWATDTPTTITQPVMRYNLGPLGCAAYSPNGKHIATAGLGVVIWDAETGERVRFIPTPGHSVWSVAFSPDGTEILTGSWDNTAKLWDIATGVLIRTFSGHTDRVNSVAFSPDGTKVLTGSRDNTAKLWQTSTGTTIHTLSGHTAGVNSVAFSPDGTKVLTGVGDWWMGDSTARLWDVQTGAEIRTFSGHTDGVLSVAFSPDGSKVLTGSNDFTARLWNASTGAEIRTFSAPREVLSVAFSPDGSKVLAGCYWNNVNARLWDTATGAEIRSFSWHTEYVSYVAFSPDGTKVLTAMGKSVDYLAFTADNTAELWDVTTWTEVRTFSGHTNVVNCVAFSADGTRMLTGTGYDDPSYHEGGVELWNALSGSLIRSTVSVWWSSDPVSSVAFSPDQKKFLTVAYYGGVTLRDADTGQVIQTFSGNSWDVTSVAFSPDGTKVLAGSRDNTAKLWQTSTGTTIHTLSGHTAGVNSVAFSPDGIKALTGSGDNTAKLWDVSTGALIRTLTGHTSAVNSVAFSPDGTKVLTGSADKTAKLWDVSTGAEVRTFSGHISGVISAAVSPDGTNVLTGSSDSTVRLWDASTGAVIRTLTLSGHISAVNSIAFSPDGTKALTGGSDGLTFLWSISTREEDKLLLVAGGGGYAGNPIAAQTRNLALLAHVTATVRGYTPENIRYLSAFETPAQNPRVDSAASADAITSAVLHWASDARRLTIMLINHGEYDPGIPEWYFLCDGTKTPRNFLTASALDAALNTAQSGGDPLPELCVYVDMCYAGGFVKRLSAAPVGTQRIVIASTASDRLANFGGGDSGSLSFTGFFLSSALLGRTLEDCFGSARTMIVALNLPSAAPQTPWLDDDGDKQFTKSDGAVAGKHVFGSHPAFGLLPPEITAAPASQSIPAPSDYQAWLELGPGRIKRAQAVVSSTADFYPGGAPITNVKTYDLAREGVTQRWSATIPGTSLRNDTRYTIVYVAYRDDGFGLEIASEPWVSWLGVSIRAEVDRKRWELYN